MQLGLTVWKLQPISSSYYGVSQSIQANSNERSRWIATRVEADAQFQEGEFIRLSIESPRDGYLYVINRDWFTDGSSGETNLIFPTRRDDNRLQAGKLIDIPAANEAPFQANPKPNQAGELLTIIVTSAPIRLPVSDVPLPISNTQLMAWEERWGSRPQRFEMEGGAGQVRTIQEQRAAALNGTRQLTREDPGPQTIYLLTPKNSRGLLFNVLLSYVR